ncbi:hypothetical protein GCM10009809_01640 [Isoptericola hypogeus]|uniref:Transcriptional regulator, AbiEi antitoxin, Type IV TA system n=1 Tax=Isoptericola hypogeus TaxID=300179 RepID=A0ABN2IPD7_9MICO
MADDTRRPPTPRPQGRRDGRRPGDTAVPVPRPLPEVIRFGPWRRSAIERQLRRGDLRRLRRGVYVPAVVDDGGPAVRRERRVLELAAAVAEGLETDFVFSHETAALVHGLSVYRLAEQVHVSQASKPTVRRAEDPCLRRHAIDVPSRDRTVVGGRPVTTIERTMVDCARWLPGARALVVADSALRAGADLEVVAAVLEEAAGKQGVRQARRIVEIADARAESTGESLVRWYALESGLAPEPSVEVLTRRGAFWVDLGWPDLKVGVEFDGLVKYSGGEYGDPRERLLAAKWRHDALAEAGWVLIHVAWDDLADPAALIDRIRAALTAALRRRTAR